MSFIAIPIITVYVEVDLIRGSVSVPAIPLFFFSTKAVIASVAYFD